MSSKTHIIWLDWARSFAILAVIICHSTEAMYPFTIDGMMSSSDTSRLAALSYFSFGRLGVPFFLFMTGYLLLDREYDRAACAHFWKTKWFGLLLATEIWIVIYDLFLSIEKGAGFDIGLLIKNMLFLENVDMSHMWYMPMILGLYLFLPFIANGLKKINDPSVLAFPLLVVFLAFFVVPVLSVFSLCTSGIKLESLFFEGFSGGVYGFYLFLGYCMKKGSFDRISSFALLVLCALLFGCVIGLQYFAYGQKVGAPVWYSSALLCIAALSLFILFSRSKRLKQNKAVTLLSDYSFALYLVHFPVIMAMSSMVKSCGLTQSVGVAVLFLISLAISLIACLLISKIPKVGRKILYMRN